MFCSIRNFSSSGMDIFICYKKPLIFYAMSFKGSNTKFPQSILDGSPLTTENFCSIVQFLIATEFPIDGILTFYRMHEDKLDAIGRNFACYFLEHRLLIVHSEKLRLKFNRGLQENRIKDVVFTCPPVKCEGDAEKFRIKRKKIKKFSTYVQCTAAGVNYTQKIKRLI